MDVFMDVSTMCVFIRTHACTHSRSSAFTGEHIARGQRSGHATRSQPLVCQAGCTEALHYTRASVHSILGARWT